MPKVNDLRTATHLSITAVSARHETLVPQPLDAHRDHFEISHTAFHRPTEWRQGAILFASSRAQEREAL